MPGRVDRLERAAAPARCSRLRLSPAISAELSSASDYQCSASDRLRYVGRAGGTYRSAAASKACAQHSDHLPRSTTANSENRVHPADAPRAGHACASAETRNIARDQTDKPKWLAEPSPSRP